MAISFIGSDGAIAASGADISMTPSPAPEANDLVIVAYSIGDNDGVDQTMAMVTPSGFTKIVDVHAEDTDDCDLGVFYKVMGATPDTTFTCDGLGGTDAAGQAVLMIFRGVDTTTPMDVTATSTTGIDTMHPNPPSIDHNNPSGVWTVIVGGSAHNVASTSTNGYTFPAGYTTNAISRSGTDTTNGSVGMGYSSGPSDPENPGVMTCLSSAADSVSYSWCSATLALRPAVPSLNIAKSNMFMLTGVGV